MWIPLGLLLKEHFQFPCLGSTLKVCIVFIVMASATSLACRGGGYWEGDIQDELDMRNDTSDTKIVDKNIKAGWDGWIPPKEIQYEWRIWYEYWKNASESEKEQDYYDDRGRVSGWPDNPGWKGLGAGSGGTPIPPWAYVPKNIGKPSLCYLPPIRGICNVSDTETQPEIRWGYNPYMDECQEYQWSGCDGSLNKFKTQTKCEELCLPLPEPTCSVDSGIEDKSG